MSKKMKSPKKFNVRKEWAPNKNEIDAKVQDVEEDNKYKFGRPAIIDGKPFIWTAVDSEFVRNVCMRTVQKKKAVTDYIKDGMNSDDSESFNW